MDWSGEEVVDYHVHVFNLGGRHPPRWCTVAHAHTHTRAHAHTHTQRIRDISLSGM